MAFRNLLKGLDYRSLSFRLFALILTAVIPGLVVSIQAGREYREREISRIHDDTLSLVRYAADDQETLLTRDTPTLLRLLSSVYPDVKNRDGERISQLFSRILREYPQYINIMEADALTGEVFASGVPLSRPLNLADRPYFGKVMKSRGYVIGEFALGRATGRPTMTCAIPVQGAGGAVRSVIAVGIDIEHMARQAALTLANKDVVITLLDRNGTIIFSSSMHEQWAGKSVSGLSLWEMMRNRNDEGTWSGPDFAGRNSYLAFKPLLGASGKGDGYVMASIGAERAQNMSDSFIRRSLLGILAGTALALLGALIMGHRSILRNVNSLVRRVERLAEGHMGPWWDHSARTTEFRRIAGAFDAMSEKLRQREGAQKSAERELFDEKERLMVTLGSIGDGVITTDSSGRIVLLNTMAQELTGWGMEDAAGMPLERVFRIINEKTREAYPNPVEKVLATGERVNMANHTLLITRDGRELVISDSGAPIRDRDNTVIGVVLVFRDITEKRRMEDEIIRSDRLESLGLLAGGIAHDFNNLLTAILGNINMAQVEPGDRADREGYLRKAEIAAERARDVTGQLLSFTTGGIIRKKAVALAEIIRDTAQFVLSGSNVRCEYILPVDLEAVEIDKGQFTQVINNLIINAVQAMPGGGLITIRGENITVAPGSPLPLAPGNYVRIFIGDQGRGIPRDNLHKIFDPFFTTRQGGMGLGLASSYSIIRRHDGHITVDSRPGKGTEFIIILPSTEKEVEGEAAAPPPFSGKGSILVMDDEAMIRDVSGKILEHLGFRADFACNGGEAIEKYRTARDAGKPYAAVIMDLTIPGAMGGVDAARALIDLDPEARILASSGYSNNAAMMDFRGYGFSGAVVKPYRIEELQKVLQEALAGEGAAGNMG